MVAGHRFDPKARLADGAAFDRAVCGLKPSNPLTWPENSARKIFGRKRAHILDQCDDGLATIGILRWAVLEYWRGR
jgi:hypothetical protein